MSNVATYRTRAAQCLARARHARDEGDKASFLEMAEEWLALAATGEDFSASAPFYPLVG